MKPSATAATAAPTKSHSDTTSPNGRVKNDQGRQGSSPSSKELKTNSRAARFAEVIFDETKSTSSNLPTGKIQRDNTVSRNDNGTDSNRMHSESDFLPRGFGGRNTAIRKQWEVIDDPHDKTRMEGQMESLFSALDGADIGALLTLSLQSPMELLNGTSESGTSLAEAAYSMMDLWCDHGVHSRWRKHEARLAGQILLRMEMEEILRNGRTYENYLAVINAYAKITAEDET